MSRKVEPSLATRKIELEKLVMFAKENRFKPSLIRDYERQLKAIEEELKQRRERRKELRALRNGGINGN